MENEGSSSNPIERKVEDVSGSMRSSSEKGTTSYSRSKSLQEDFMEEYASAYKSLQEDFVEKYISAYRSLEGLRSFHSVPTEKLTPTGITDFLRLIASPDFVQNEAIQQAIRNVVASLRVGKVINPTVLRIRLTEEPLTLRNLNRLLSTLIDLYVKCYLIEQNRVADLMRYMQTKDEALSDEAEIIIRALSKNSPTLIELVLGSTTAALALKLGIDAVIQVPLRYQEKKLANEKKAQELTEQQRQRDIEHQKETHRVGVEKLRDQLQLKREEAELQRELLRLQEEEMVTLLSRREQGVRVAMEIVNVLQPNAEIEKKSMLAESMVSEVLQLGMVRGLASVVVVDDSQGSLQESTDPVSNE